MFNIMVLDCCFPSACKQGSNVTLVFSLVCKQTVNILQLHIMLLTFLYYNTLMYIHCFNFYMTSFNFVIIYTYIFTPIVTWCIKNRSFPFNCKKYQL